MNVRTVESSHGELTIDATGNILARKLDNVDPDGGGHLARILRFDLDEWRTYWGASFPSFFDILDLGYWHADLETGEKRYSRPVENWRKDIASRFSCNVSGLPTRIAGQNQIRR